MSVFKRDNSPFYQYDFVINGQREFGSTKVRHKEKGSEKRAKSVERALMVRAEAGEKLRASGANQKLSDYIEKRVLPNVQLRLKDKPNSITFYVSGYKKICQDPIADLALNKINVSAIEDFTQRLGASDYEVATINRRLSCLRKALNLAVKEEVLLRAPKVEMLPGENRRERVLIGLEKELFLAGIVNYLRPATEFAFETGLRITEICTLTKDRVVLNGVRAYIKIPRAISKSKEDRFVPLTPRAKVIAKSQMKLSKSGYVFTRYGDVKGLQGANKPRTGPIEQYVYPLSRHTLSHAFTAQRVKMGLPKDLVFHSTRHSFATEVGAAGADLFTLMSTFGWKSPDQAKRYIHPMQENIYRAIDRTIAMREQNLLETSIKE